MQDPEILTELKSLVDDLIAQVSSCETNRTERDAEVDRLVMVVEQETRKNKKLDGFMENCQEDKMNITGTV